MGKNIVIFADGTARDGDGTNVSKLHWMAEDRSPQQLIRYLPGVGTEQKRITGTVGGLGISRYMLECYKFINDNFMVGDEIFLFGFSRGATMVVSLAKFMHDFGLLPRRPGILQEAYKIYKIKNPEVRKRRMEDFVGRKNSMWCMIKFVGLFDTVASLGLPFPIVDGLLDHFLPHRFHLRDRSFSESVENLYHALAIDEERLWFQPVIWDPPRRLQQKHSRVWFCGSHSDVGGGHFEEGLSDIPLDWMMHNAQAHGFRIYSHHNVKPNLDPNGIMHDSRIGALSRYYPRRIRSWDSAAYGKPIIHESVLERTLNSRNTSQPGYAPWILDRSLEYDVEPWRRI